MTTAAAPFGITTGANRIIPQYDSTRRSQRSSSSEGNAVLLLLLPFTLVFFHRAVIMSSTIQFKLHSSVH